MGDGFFADVAVAVAVAFEGGEGGANLLELDFEAAFVGGGHLLLLHAVHAGEAADGGLIEFDGLCAVASLGECYFDLVTKLQKPFAKFVELVGAQVLDGSFLHVGLREDDVILLGAILHHCRGLRTG
jgi:hypothetical protein